MRHITQFAPLVCTNFKPSYALIWSCFWFANLKNVQNWVKIMIFHIFNPFFSSAFFFSGKSNRWGISHQFAPLISYNFKPSYASFRAVLIWNQRTFFELGSWLFFTILNGFIFFSKSNWWGTSHNLRLWFEQILSLSRLDWSCVLVCKSWKMYKDVDGLGSWLFHHVDFNRFLSSALFFSANLINEAYHTICAFGLYKF